MKGGSMHRALTVLLFTGGSLVGCKHSGEEVAKVKEAAKVSIKEDLEKMLLEDIEERNKLIQLIKENRIDEIPANSPVHVEDGTYRVRAIYSATSTADPGQDIVEKAGFKYDHLGEYNTQGYIEDFMEIHQDGSISYPALVFGNKIDFEVEEDSEENGEYQYSLAINDRYDAKEKLDFEAIWVARLLYYYPKLTHKEANKAYKQAYAEAKAKNDEWNLAFNIGKAFKKAGYPKVDFGRPTLVMGSNSQIHALVFAHVNGRSSRQLLTFIEGGNILVGVNKEGEQYALIGRDSIAVSKALLSKEAGRQLSEDEILKIVGKDYGISPKRLFVIDQPGEFHLDMSVSLGRKGKIIVNNSEKAYQMQVNWTKNSKNEDWLETMEMYAKPLSEFRQPFEDQIEKQLKNDDFEVKRIAGVFFYHDIDSDTMQFAQRANYLNAEKGINPQGKSYAIVFDKNPGTWGHPQEEAEKQKVIENVRQAFEVDEIYLMSDSGEFLDGNGAVACILKGENEVP
jgi:hypothetical protein